MAQSGHQHGQLGDFDALDSSYASHQDNAVMMTPATTISTEFDGSIEFDQAFHSLSSINEDHHLISELDGCSYRVGDWVIVATHDGSPQVGQVTKVDDADDGSHILSIWNYALPEQTHHLPSTTFWENEVFRTTDGSIWPCSAVISRCCVVSLAQMTAGRPCAAVWDASTPLFVCIVPFAPLQRWTELDVTMIDYFPYPRPPASLQSPFLRGLCGSGGLIDEYGLPLELVMPELPLAPPRPAYVPFMPPTPDTPSLEHFEPIASTSRATYSRPPPPVAQSKASTSAWVPLTPNLEWPTTENILSCRDASLPPLLDNPHFRQPHKPPFSYASLIAQAIYNAPGQRARLEQIYEYIRLAYPYYKTCDNQWQNMLRHNLSLRPVFVKKAKEGNMGKGNWWTMDLSLEPLGFSGLEFGTRRGVGTKNARKARASTSKGSKGAAGSKRKGRAAAMKGSDDYED